MNKTERILSRLVNSLFDGEVSDDTALFVLENSAQINETDEMQTMAYVFTCSASIALVVQRHHSKESLKDFFNALGSFIANIDDFLSIRDDATNSMKVELLESIKPLPEVYAQVIAGDAERATLDSTCADLIVQSAINGMLMSVIEKID